MSRTPICDFARAYAESAPARLHMPGHKGRAALGCEPLDITEIHGAGDLYAPAGIVAESERYASEAFGCHTFYSAEGSSLCMRAMLWLAVTETGSRRVLAARNAHKTFIHAAAMLDLEIEWLWQEGCVTGARPVTAAAVEAALASASRPIRTVYITAPDYLGQSPDLAAIAAVCRRRGALLLVDNAHGAYLKFLPESRHPMDLGADLCCDSAHKTLPVLTGGAYLQIRAPQIAARAKEALALFGSTSPSYLILQSLDRMNAQWGAYSAALAAFLPRAAALKEELARRGYPCCGEEPLKITVRAKAAGYTGAALAGILETGGVYCEYADPDFLVLMIAPQNTPEDFARLLAALPAPRAPLQTAPPCVARPVQALSPREACLSASETLPAAQCVGRICASASVSCPPAVPIVMCGERIGADAPSCFRYYGVEQICVVKE